MKTVNRAKGFLLFLLLPAAILRGQGLDNKALTGKYYFRHVLLTADATGTPFQASSLAGSMTFDGSGRFTFQGQQTAGAAAPAGLSGSGTYTVKPSGFVSLTNPQRSDLQLQLNARLGMGDRKSVV